MSRVLSEPVLGRFPTPTCTTGREALLLARGSEQLWALVLKLLRRRQEGEGQVVEAALRKQGHPEASEDRGAWRREGSREGPCC